VERAGASACWLIMIGRADSSNETARQSVVLVVEDEPLLCNTVAEYLQLSGYAVIKAAGAAEAVTVLASGTTVDVVFSDVRMPGAMDGLQLAQWVRRRHGDIPVMLTSGQGAGDATPPAGVEFSPPSLID
jgi:CheY-like chemotaxis protein